MKFMFLSSTLLASSNVPLISWLNNVPSCYVHPAISIQKSVNGDGLGCFVTQSIAEDELLFSIPTSVCISYKDAMTDEECGETFSEIVEKAGAGGKTVAMAGFLAKQYLKLEHQGMDKYDGPYGAYLKSLPFELGKNEQDHVLWWSDNEVKSLLKGSLAYDDTIGIREEVDLAVKVLSGVIGPSVKKFRQGILPFGGNTEGVTDTIRGAFVTILTRSFLNEAESDQERLVPLLDMLQHTSSTPNIMHCTSEEFVDVRARQSLEAGTELVNSYSYSLEPWNFFTRFGFVPNFKSGSVRDLLKKKDPLFFDPNMSPKIAEV